MIVNMELYCHIFIFWILIWILCIREQECCRFGPGANCGFPCKCTGNNVCDPDTGTCLDGSQCQSVNPDGYGWNGPGCRIGNVAYAKTNVFQSGAYVHYSADLAVDGDTTPYITNEIGESCAHPLTAAQFAWWWVDLGDIFTIQVVFIVNRLTMPGTEIKDNLFRGRSTDYDIKVGNTSDRTTQALCFHQRKHRDEVQPIETITCDNGDMVGQYVSFTRTGGKDPNEAAICEFIVIGHKTMECHRTDCNGTCDPVTGCDQCVAGKKLPDCKQVCPDGYWGINCNHACGMCKDGVACDKVTGSCGDQCEGWFIPQLCAKPLMLPPEPLNVAVSNITSASATLSWDRFNGVNLSTRQYFYYIVQYRRKDVTTDDWSISEQIPLSNKQSFLYKLLGLVFNTEYEVQIIPYRALNGLMEAGIIETAECKTLCIGPDSPPSPSIHGTPDRFTVTWEALPNVLPGCDRLEYAAVIITCENSTRTLLNETFNILITTNAFTYDTTKAVLCSVVLSITNSAGFSSTSAAATLTRATTTVTDLPITQKETFKTAQVPTEKRQIKDSGPNITAIVVGAVAGVVNIILVVVIVVLVLRKRRDLPSASAAKPDTGATGKGKPNPVYENTKNNDNGMATNSNPSAEYESVDSLNITDNKVTTSMTPNALYENTKGPESQYASLEDAHRNNPQPLSLYQELK